MAGAELKSAFFSMEHIPSLLPPPLQFLPWGIQMYSSVINDIKYLRKQIADRLLEISEQHLDL